MNDALAIVALVAWSTLIAVCLVRGGRPERGPLPTGWRGLLSRYRVRRAVRKARRLDA